MRAPSVPRPLEVWGGVECTVNRVGDRWFDQIIRSGHQVRPSDLRRFAALGIRALRYPVVWERLAPHSPDAIDWRWTDERLGLLRDLGIRPIVGLLHHGSGPAYTSLLDPEFPALLARFAEAVARRYPWIRDFTPINEPLTTARFSGLYGHWYPHHTSDSSFIRAFLNQVRATVLAMRAIRQVSPDARLIQTEDCGQTFGTTAMKDQVAHEEARRWLTWDALTGAITDRHPLHRFLTRAGMTSEDEDVLASNDASPDILGLNYYLTSDRYLDDRWDRYPACTHGGNGHLRYADHSAVQARPEGIAGHAAHLSAAWRRYGLPVALTEVHLGCTREEQMRWLAEAWRGCHVARARGADVRAMTAWALLGSHDWNSLVTREAGHYEPGAFDTRSDEPRPTAIARMIFDLAQHRRPHALSLSDQPGWWHRPRQAARAARPAVILGAAGTLGRAFLQVCESRGLETRAIVRGECDISDAGAVEATLQEIRPWVVINACGYVRVDAAECDEARCRAANVMGPVNLARACRHLGIPLVTFSSDLVFDGGLARAYVEDDTPRPLNVYGVTKAEAEQQVLEILPSALVIRTSAFFGPWDTGNFAARMLQTIEKGEPFVAASDTTVSPTYVPHLVQATLDLLIDGESGIWHLANQGALSWFEFARTIATHRGAAVDLIAPAPAQKIWVPAVRPRYSALSSQRGVLLPTVEAAVQEFLKDAEPACLPSTPTAAA